MTKAEIADLVLEELGVKAAGVAASAADVASVESRIDSVMDQLRGRGLAPFEISAVPDWAQEPLSKIVAYRLVNIFGITGERLMSIREGAQMAEREMHRQTAHGGIEQPARVRFY